MLIHSPPFRHGESKHQSLLSHLSPEYPDEQMHSKFCTKTAKRLRKIDLEIISKPPLFSLNYAEGRNEWCDPTTRLCACATQLRRNIEVVAAAGESVADVTGLGTTDRQHSFRNRVNNSTPNSKNSRQSTRYE